MKSMKKFMTLYFTILWIVSISIQLALASHFRGYIGDQMIFSSWMRDLQQFGLAGTYSMNHVDYPPVFLMILEVYGKITQTIGVNVVPGGLWIKIPGIAISGLAMMAFFLLVRNGTSNGGANAASARWQALILAVFCLNPAILFDTAVWGQVDILDGTLVLTAVAAYTLRSKVSGAAFSVALLSKFQSIVVFPVLALEVLRDGIHRRNFRRSLGFVVWMAIPWIVVGVILALHGAFTTMIYKAYIATTGEYPYLSMNAMNIWYYLFGISPHTSDTSTLILGIRYKWIGLGLLCAATLYVLFYLWRSQRPRGEVLLKASAVISFAFFMLPTEIHERYILMALIFSIVVSLFDKGWFLIAFGMTLTSFFNLWSVVYTRVNPTADMWMVYLNLVLFIAMIVMTKQEIMWVGQGTIGTLKEV